MVNAQVSSQLVSEISDTLILYKGPIISLDLIER